MLRKIIYATCVLASAFAITSCGGSNSPAASSTTNNPALEEYIAAPFTTSTGTNVPLNPLFMFNFNLPLNATAQGTLPANELITVTNNRTGNQVALAAETVMNNLNGSSVNFSTLNLLGQNESYTITVPANITATNGQTLGTPISYQFTTGVQGSLQVGLSSPTQTTNVTTNTPIILTANVPLITSTCTTANVQVSNNTAQQSLAGSVTCSGLTATFTPSAPLPSNASLTVIVQNLLGQPTTGGASYALPAAESFTFTTAGRYAVYGTGGNIAGNLSNLAVSPDGLNWSANAIALNYNQVLVSARNATTSNLLLLGATGAIQESITASGFGAPNNVQAYVRPIAPGAATNNNVIEYAANGSGTIVGVNSITSANGGGFVYSTNNGQTWSQANIVTPVGTTWVSIAYGSVNGTGYFVAVDNGTGANQGVAYSTNGIQWTTYSLGVGTSNTASNVVFLNGMFMFVNGALATPTLYYTGTSTPTAAGNWLNAAVTTGLTASSCGAANNIPVVFAYGAAGTSNNYLFIGCANAVLAGSTMAMIQWPAGGTIGTIFASSAFAGNASVIRNINVYSQNVIIGTSASAANNLFVIQNTVTIGAATAPSAVSAVGATAVVTGVACANSTINSFNGCIATINTGTVPSIVYAAISGSTIPTTWLTNTTLTLPGYVANQAFAVNLLGNNASITYNSVNGSFVVVGGNTGATGSAFALVPTFVSGFPTTWASVTQNPVLSINNIASSPGLYVTSGSQFLPLEVAVGQGGAVYTSVNAGSTWSTVTGVPSTNNLAWAACSATTCAAVGSTAGIYAPTTTANLTTAWAQVPGATSGVIYNYIAYLGGVNGTGGYFVAVGQGGNVASSPDGFTWTNVTTTPANNLVSVAYGLNFAGTPTYVAISNVAAATTGIFYFSQPASNAAPTTWFNATTAAAPAGTMTWVAYGNVGGIPGFLAAGNAGSVAYTQDGAGWVTGTAGAGANNWVTSSNSQWVVSNAGAGAATSIYFSSNPQQGNWTAVTLPAGITVNSVWYFSGLNSFIAAIGAVAGAQTNYGVYITPAPLVSASVWVPYLSSQSLTVLSKVIAF